MLVDDESPLKTRGKDGYSVEDTPRSLKLSMVSVGKRSKTKSGAKSVMIEDDIVSEQMASEDICL